MTEETILLVEDSDVLRQGLKSLLEQENYAHPHAGDGWLRVI
jgi:DNA-binding response OmpR family regulator